MTLACTFGAVGAVVSIKKLRLAGVGSILFAISIALTSKVWYPSTSPVYVYGEAHTLYDPPSIRHS
jgi:hypothetical protein